MKVNLGKRIFTVGRALSQVLNAINAALFWDGEDFETVPFPEDVTFSAYVGYKNVTTDKLVWKFWRIVVDTLFRWQTKDHCYWAYLSEADRFKR